MFMNDYTHKGGIRIHVVNYLSRIGLPCKNIYEQGRSCSSNRWERAKIRFIIEDDRELVKIYRTKIFRVPLNRLHKKKVELKTGQTLPIPKIVHDICESVLGNVETESIFQKTGSRTEQYKIMLKIDNRGRMEDAKLNVVDVAAILKYLLRALPQPLIPYAYHKLFLACCNLRNKREVLLIAVLLLPTDHLNLLTYLMQFFNEVSTYSKFNKMNSERLALCIAPDIIPVCKFSHGIFDRTTEVTKILITESYYIGLLTTDILKKLELEESYEYKTTNALDSFLSWFKKFLSRLM